MGTVATPTKTHGPSVIPGEGVRYKFTVLLDTTTSGGLQTVDITDYFSYVTDVTIGGTLAGNFYHIEVQKPAFDTALTSTNLALAFSEAGADGAVLDLMNAADLSTAITGLTLTVTGKATIATSWA
jgi:hypothetical protein